MIRLAKSIEELAAAEALDPIGGAAVCALYRCYHPYPFADFYIWEVEGTILGSLCRYDGGLNVCCGPDGTEELAEFLALLGGFQGADLPVQLACQLHALCGGSVEEFTVMQARQPLQPTAERYHRAGTVCEINWAAGEACGDSTAWTADFSHRMRHGGAAAFVLHRDGQAAATASVSHIGLQSCIIGCVATRPQYQGQGLGKACAATAIAHGQALGLDTYLCCAPELEGFYAALGCVPIGRRANYFM